MTIIFVLRGSIERDEIKSVSRNDNNNGTNIYIFNVNTNIPLVDTNLR